MGKSPLMGTPWSQAAPDKGSLTIQSWLGP